MNRAASMAAADIALPLTAAPDSDTAPAGATLPCFHCGEDAPNDGPWHVAFDDRMRPLCCAGCEAAATTIIEGGLGDYYRHRRDYAARPAMLDTLIMVGDAPPRTPAPVGAADATISLYLTHLRCAACAWLAESVLKRIDGVAAADVHLTLESARIRYDAARLAPADLITALRRVGLGAVEAHHTAPAEARRRARRRQLIELGVAWLGMMQVMMLTIPLYLASPGEVSADVRALLGWAAWALTLPVLFLPGGRILMSAWRGLAAGHIVMDVPVALALLLTFAAGTHGLLAGDGPTYFDAVTMFVALVVTARFVEGALRADARARIERLAHPAPVVARRVVGFPQRGVIEDVDAVQLAAGDIVEVPEGAPVPADGTLIDGASEFDESLMTGESLPVARRTGDTVIGGAINRVSPVLLRVDAPVQQSTLARLARLVEQGLTARHLLPGTAQRVARLIAPATLMLAALGYATWLWLDPSRSLDIAVAVLAVTCPCAFALAAPTVAAAAFDALARSGLLATRGHVLDACAHATDIVLDKTGTLTAGTLHVETVHVLAAPHAPAVLHCAAALEAGSAHPLALALRHAVAAPECTASDIRHRPGLGVEGTIGGIRHRLGRPDFGAADAATPPARPGATRIVLSVQSTADTDDWRALGVIDLIDTPRLDAAKAIADWRAHGLSVHLLSGDDPAATAAAAETAGIEPSLVRARQSADEKRAYVAALRQRGRIVVAVGDGVNDAPMLSAADAGIGLATGAALTSLAADAVADNRKRALFACLAGALALARRADRVTRQNLYWAFGYNALAVPLALAGVVSPLFAAVGMAASSLIVVINAARLSTWNRSGS